MRIRRETITEQCVRLLREDIFERRLLPGTPVTEDALAREMGVSRATVREVLNTLTVEGLLTRNPTTRILHVTRLGAERIREIYRARRLLETGGIAAYAGREDAALTPLLKVTEKLVAAIASGNPREIVRYDIACHVEIVGLAGAPDLMQFYGRLLAKLQLAMATVTRSHRYDLHKLRDDHVGLVDLLKERRTEEAELLVIDRLDRAEARLLVEAEDAEF